MAKVTGLEGVIAADSDISLVDGERGYLVYRGHWAKELALSYTYEETAFLLWYGHLPSQEEYQSLKLRLAAYRYLPEAVRRIIDLMPASASMMTVLQTAITAIGAIHGETWPPTISQAEHLTAITPTIIAYRARKLEGLPDVEPLPALSHTANYLYMLAGQIPDISHEKALQTYLILGMEHGFNASTFAGRVILSTESDMSAAVSGAIGAMKGPLHGGAPYEVIAMLEEIGVKENAEPWMRSLLENGGRLMGFGHRVYKTSDPRADALRIVTAQLSGDDASFQLAIHVENTAIQLLKQFKPGRRLYTNVEFFAAAIMRAIELPPALFTPTFTVARIVGWTAHMLEQASVNRIFRPQSVYTGKLPDELAE